MYTQNTHTVTDRRR